MLPLYFFNSVLLIYFIIFSGISFFSSLIIYTRNKIADNVLYFILAFLAILFYGLIKPDSPDFEMYFNEFIELSSFEDFSWGWSFYAIYKAIAFFNQSAEAFLFGIAFFIIIFLSKAIYLVIPPLYRVMTLSLYIFSWGFLDMTTNTIRQGLAIPFIILFVYYFAYKKYIKTVITLFIAFGFHWSIAFLAILIYIAHYFSININLLKKFTLWLLIYIIVILFFSINFPYLLASFLSNLHLDTILTGVDLQRKYDAYLYGASLGVDFYEYDLVKKIYSISEVLFALTFNLIIFNKIAKANIKNNKLYYVFYSSFLFFCIYAFLLISMIWFFRNFYWALGLMPITTVLGFSILIKHKKKSGIRLLLLFLLFYILLSSFTCWRSGIINLIYSV